MTNKIYCNICKKEIKENDEVILGSKDNYFSLPEDIKSSEVVFLHTECFKKYAEENKND